MRDRDDEGKAARHKSESEAQKGASCPSPSLDQLSILSRPQDAHGGLNGRKTDIGHVFTIRHRCRKAECEAGDDEQPPAGFH